MESRSLCCIGVSFGARIIGAYTMMRFLSLLVWSPYTIFPVTNLSTMSDVAEFKFKLIDREYLLISISILLINVLVSNFFAKDGDNDFFEAVKTWAILGINWVQAMRYTQLQKKAQAALICFLIYAILFVLASAYLALGSISRRHMSAVPWMYLQMISIIDQIVALCSHIIYEQQNVLYLWYLTICSVYLILSIYFWVVVEAARNQWHNEQNQITNYESNTLDFISTPNNNTKSPSFLSQNFSLFESPRVPSIILK